MIRGNMGCVSTSFFISSFKKKKTINSNTGQQKFYPVLEFIEPFKFGCKRQNLPLFLCSFQLCLSRINNVKMLFLSTKNKSEMFIYTIYKCYNFYTNNKIFKFIKSRDKNKKNKMFIKLFWYLEIFLFVFFLLSYYLY